MGDAVSNDFPHSILSDTISDENCSQQDGEIQFTFSWIFNIHSCLKITRIWKERGKRDQIYVPNTVFIIQILDILIVDFWLPTHVFLKPTRFLTSDQPTTRSKNNHGVESAL